MRARHCIAIAVVLLAATACGSTPAGNTGRTATASGSTVPSQAPPPPVILPSGPASALAAAKDHLGRESARFAQVSGNDRIDFTGMVDAETRNWEITGKGFVLRRVGTDMYMQASGKTLADMPAPPAIAEHFAAGGWLRTPLPNGHEHSIVYGEAFPWNLANPASRATGVRRVAARAFDGTLVLKEGRKLRVKIDLDDRGRFAGIGLSKPGDDPEIRYTFADYGVRADIVAPPPDDVVTENNAFLLPLLYLP